MSLSRYQIIIIAVAAILLIVLFLIFTGILPGRKQATDKPPDVSLNIYGFESRNAFTDFIDNYVKIRSNVRINYYQISPSNYEQGLISAMASGRAPDIFMFHSSWLPKHFEKIYPVPQTQLSLIQFRQLFPMVAEQDFTRGETIFALPLYIDTPALLYNKDIFDAKKVPILPSTWTDFQKLVPQIREVNDANQVTLQAAAIGGSGRSIDGATDLLELIMAQFGNPSVGEDGEIKFNPDAFTAFDFYRQFSNSLSPYYTWSDDLGNSLDNFSQGKTAAIFNYMSRIPLIKSKNPVLNFGVAPMPQLGKGRQTVNIADYWGLTVSKASQNPTWAWDFVIQTATNPDVADAYSKSVTRPPALRSLISKYINDPQIGVFASQALTARSWAKPDSAAVRQIYENMIELVLDNRMSTKEALVNAREEMNRIMK
ncbi:extracellular solute-binding protein [Candidatus Wolfebacteria bacterium]|nr:extracellular solute-binding protein [Candidatus Wolfebacteria bacterium]